MRQTALPPLALAVALFLPLGVPLGAAPAAGQEPSSNPRFFASFRGAVYFQAEDGVSGAEMWRSDGTEEGTHLFADLCDGPCSGYFGPVAVTDSHLFFAGASSSGAIDLWVTQGTAVSTFQLTQFVHVFPGAVWQPEQKLLYFLGQDEEHGAELWRSDGTPAGTYLVADLWTGKQGSPGSSRLTAFQGGVYFAGHDGKRGLSLWRSDGTPGRISLVHDSFPSAFATAPRILGVAGTRLVFVAASPNGGEDLYATDGKAGGVRALTRFSRDRAATSIHNWSVQGDRLYFVADDGRNGQELWVTDGTPSGTRALTAFVQPAPQIGFNRGALASASPGGRFVFSAHDGRRGVELWVTDGTPRGTRLLRDICPGACSAVSGLEWGRVIRGQLYFKATDGEHGEELWATDGTAAGTRLVADLCPGSCSGSPDIPFPFRDRMLFVAGDGVHGRQLWASNGNAADTSGTVRLTDFGPGQDPESYLDGASVAGKRLFAGYDPVHGVELWRTDGTAAGTFLLKDIHTID